MRSSPAKRMPSSVLDVGLEALDRLPELVEDIAGRDEVDVLDAFEHAGDPFPSEEAVVAENDADHRAAPIGPSLEAPTVRGVTEW
jgi:hypothetical protein